MLESRKKERPETKEKKSRWVKLQKGRGIGG
jgi:hypothetical protein